MNVDTTKAEGTTSVEDQMAVSVHAGIAATGADPTLVIKEVLDDKGGKQGSIANGGVTDDSRPEITGTAAAGVVVHVYNNSELIGHVTADANGEWSLIPRSPLVDGRHEISIIHEYPDGDVSDLSVPYVIFVDKVAPDTPVILGMVDDEGRITAPFPMKTSPTTAAQRSAAPPKRLPLSLFMTRTRKSDVWRLMPRASGASRPRRR